MRLLCDEMLARLGRWLRAAGYDTRIADEGSDDRSLLATASAEARIVITRDRGLAERGDPSTRTVLLTGNDLLTQAEELRQRLGIDWLRDPFTRCVVDNTPLQSATGAELRKLPSGARAGGEPFMACPTCGRLYWQGSHHRRMRQRLESWERVSRNP